MQNTSLTQKIAEATGTNDAPEDTKAILSEINEKLGILIDMQRGRQPPEENGEGPQSEYPTVVNGIDISWIDPNKLYDNSQFCRIFNIQPPTAQKWRSNKMIEYIKIGNKSVRYPGWSMIRFLNLYAAPRNFKITPVRLTTGD